MITINTDNPQFGAAKAYEDIKSNLDVSLKLNDSLSEQIKQLTADNAALTIPNWQRIADSIFIVGLSWGYLNIPYLFGGEYENNKAFDCSSFTQKVFGYHGIKLLRTSYEQVTQGVEVAKADIRKGDLVFYKFKTSDKPVDHVGIADGQGNYLQTNEPGKTIRIIPMQANGYVTARRLF